MTNDPYDGLTRAEYVDALAHEIGVPVEMARVAAEMLGPNEDFDGLVTELEDLAQLGAFD